MKLAFFILCLFAGNFLFSQSFSDSGVGVSYGRGFITPHHKELEYLANKNINFFELYYTRKSNGSKYWHSLYKYPDFGFELVFADFKSPSILGNAFGFAPFAKLPVIKTGKSSLNANFSLGLAYLTKIFDAKTNVYNLVISSKINILARVGVGYCFKLSDHLEINSGIGLTHFSNGSIKYPNLGLNIVSGNFSISYLYKNKKVAKTSIEFPKSKYFKYNLILSMGLKELADPYTKKYLTGSVSGDVFMINLQTHSLGFGGDLFYNSAISDFTPLDSIYQSQKRNSYYPGIHLTYSQDFGRMSFIVQFGAYVFWRPYDYQTVFSRYGLRYRFSNNIIANLTLKTYFAAADFVEFGIGYCVFKNRKIKIDKK